MYTSDLDVRSVRIVASRSYEDVSSDLPCLHLPYDKFTNRLTPREAMLGQVASPFSFMTVMIMHVSSYYGSLFFCVITSHMFLDYGFLMFR